MALALEKTENILNKDNISVVQYTHARKDIALRLLEQLKLLRFNGVSVSMKYYSTDKKRMHENSWSHLFFKYLSIWFGLCANDYTRTFVKLKSSSILLSSSKIQHSNFRIDNSQKR